MPAPRHLYEEREICRGCTRLFVRTSPAQKYCSPECREQSRRKDTSKTDRRRKALQDMLEKHGLMSRERR